MLQLTLFSILTFLLISVLSFYGYRQLKRLIKTRGCSPKKLFKDFNQKIWMTFGLGLFFLGLYAGFVFSLSLLLDKQNWLSIFTSVYEKPVLFIYGGLFLFVFFSLLIYLIRTLIVYIFNTRELNSRKK